MTLAELRQILAERIQGTPFSGKAWFAGGCVRDFLLERAAPLLDADIAVELPQGGIRLARYLQRQLQTAPPEFHRSFGTATLRYNGIHLDFVMTRGERYFPGSRHPRVHFADLATDCLRRDFTLNALYMDITSGAVLDPCGKGLDDLQARLLSSLRDPEASFREDPLRILRALRFTVVLDCAIETAILDACRTCAPLIASLSKNRLLNELERLQATADPAQLQKWATLAMSTGVLQYLEQKLGPGSILVSLA